MSSLPLLSAAFDFSYVRYFFGTSQLIKHIYISLIFTLLPFLSFSQQANPNPQLTKQQLEIISKAGEEIRSGNTQMMIGLGLSILSVGAGAYLATKEPTVTYRGMKDYRKQGLIVMGVGGGLGMAISISGASGTNRGANLLNRILNPRKKRSDYEIDVFK